MHAQEYRPYKTFVTALNWTGLEMVIVYYQVEHLRQTWIHGHLLLFTAAYDLGVRNSIVDRHPLNPVIAKSCFIGSEAYFCPL